jgi:hypothetical protein
MKETAYAMGKFLGPRQATSLEVGTSSKRRATFGNGAATALSAASGKPPHE